MLKLKYFSDLVLALLLLILISPVLLLIAVLVFCERSGPVFFLHPRIGQGGGEFKMFKFRSMRQICADKQVPAAKHPDDPRISRLGAFLRRSSLDELPQLLNVLRGEMSLIGPRPLPLGEAAALEPEILARRGRLKPGMTGLWQVSGRSHIADMSERLRLDLYYVENWSLWLDLKIALRTVPAVLSGRGAW